MVDQRAVGAVARAHVMPGDPPDIMQVALQWYLGFDFGYPHTARESNIAVEGFKDGYRAALAAARPIIMEDQWQPIETAPRDGTWIWAFWPVSTFEDQQTPTRWVESSFEDGPYWQDRADHIDWCEPTHWQPLPAPPRTAGSKTDAPASNGGE